MELDGLVKTLVDAASTAGKSLFERSRSFLIPELEEVAKRLLAIEIGVKSGEVTRDLAREMLTMQVDSAEDSLVTLAELTELEAQRLINTALKAVADVVNRSVGFPLV